jgi:tRNA(Ile)-lysidine synthase
LVAKPVSAAVFSTLLSPFDRELAAVKAVAVGVSGGPDSLALAYLLAAWAEPRGIMVHALTVDHALRAGSAAEAKAVACVLKPLNITHNILKWGGRKPKTRIMESARAARYKLMAEYCSRHEIKHLFLAHHMDDQAETFLLRLAAGSGLDGLAGMKPLSRHRELSIIRPFLSVSKDQLITTCRHNKLPFIKDPSNSLDRYARPRLRKTWQALSSEGLTSKRLVVTASRLARAQKSLDEITDIEYKNSLIEFNSKRSVFKLSRFNVLVEEVQFRVLVKAVKALRPDQNYMPRMEKIEALFADLISPEPFRKRTLGGLIFERNDRRDSLTILIEKP